MVQRNCDICRRPATTAIRRVVPGQAPRVGHLCEVHAAQVGDGRTGSDSPFEDFFGRFFDERSPGGAVVPAGAAPSGRRTKQVDITQFFSDSTSDLLQRVAEQAVEWGSRDLATEHLLHAALEEVTEKQRPLNPDMYDLVEVQARPAH